jgi:hypothetical protein
LRRFSTVKFGSFLCPEPAMLLYGNLTTLGSQLLNLCSSFKVPHFLQAVTLELYGDMVRGPKFKDMWGEKMDYRSSRSRRMTAAVGGSSSASKKMQEWLEEAMVMLPYQI